MSAKEIVCNHCGCLVELPHSDRSTPQNNRYHAMIKATFDHWREDHPELPHPRNVRHLRKFLEMKAGHFVVTKHIRITRVDPPKDLYDLCLALMAHSEDETLFLELDGDLLIQKKALSIAYEKLDSKEFSRLK